jgi:hypothetical protein
VPSTDLEFSLPSEAGVFAFLLIMAYPFPKSTASPQTPQEFKEIQTPRANLTARTRLAAAIYKIFAVAYVVVTLLILWKLRPGSGFWSKAQSDRIPDSLSRSHGGIQE